jgi:uncharacterized protein YdeI (YjbR/CyaY-like superfamily)
VEEARRDAGLKPVFFETPEQLAAWLEEHHETEDELWVGLYKKASGKPSVTWPEVVEQALRFGWIDGVRRGIDDESYANRLTPRRPGSNWSAVNVAKVEELKERGLMKPAGLRAYEARRPDRTGVYSFEREPAELPPEFEERFRSEAQAWEWFQSRPPGYRRTATHWVVSAKRPETRERRLAQLIEDSAAGLDVKPLRRR